MSSKASKQIYRLLIIFARALFGAFRSYFHLVEDLLQFAVPEYRRPAILRDIVDRQSDLTLDDRIKKIDAARENLQDAISAIDELRRQASTNKAELEEALTRIAEAERQKQALSEQLDTLKQIAKVDTASFRRVGVYRLKVIFGESAL